MSKQSALRTPRWVGGDSFGFVAMSGPHSVAGFRHQVQQRPRSREGTLLDSITTAKPIFMVSGEAQRHDHSVAQRASGENRQVTHLREAAGYMLACPNGIGY